MAIRQMLDTALMASPVQGSRPSALSPTLIWVRRYRTVLESIAGVIRRGGVAATSYLYGGIEAGGTKFVCAVGKTPHTIQASTSIATTTPTATLSQVIAFFQPY